MAIGLELARKHQDIIIIEKNHSFGQETSSRNSEVIHSGIYYPKDSLKTKTCIEGRHLLYEFCSQNNIGHRRIGKLIVAVEKNEIAGLKALLKKGIDNGVEDLAFLDKNKIKRIEPHIRSEAAVYSPSTGILDSHSFMKAMELMFKSCGGQVAYNTELIGIDKSNEGFIVHINDRGKENFKFCTRVLINCAGLSSDKVAEMSGIKRNDYRLKYCKGDYFRVHNSKAKFIQRLIYPVPKKGRAGLGIHATLDLAGSLKLGPDDEYIDNLTYDVNASKGKVFYESVRGFLPFINEVDLSADMAGIRPKLQGEQEGFRDFLIQDESDKGLAGLINLIGIESPGLTASLSIAKMVSRLIKQ